MCAPRSQHYGAVTTPEHKSARASAALIVIETPPAIAVASGHSPSDQALRREDEGFLFLVARLIRFDQARECYAILVLLVMPDVSGPVAAEKNERRNTG